MMTITFFFDFCVDKNINNQANTRNNKDKMYNLCSYRN